LNILRRSKKENPSKITRNSKPPPQEDRGSEFEQQETPSPTLEFRTEIADGSLSTFFMEYQMTVQPTVRNLTSKEASILLSMAVAEAIVIGVDISSYFIMEWLFNFLLKYSSIDPTEYPYEKGRQTLLLAELTLTAIRGLWLSLGEREQLPEEVVKAINSSGWLPKPQTYQSWKSHYSLQKYFRGRAVRLDSFQERERNSQRYSSYTKGYGEGGSLARKQKTPFSAELDGDDSERNFYEFSLLEIAEYNHILLTIEKWRSIKRNGND